MENNSVMRKGVYKHIQVRIGMRNTTFVFHVFRGKNACHYEWNSVKMSHVQSFVV